MSLSHEEYNELIQPIVDARRNSIWGAVVVQLYDKISKYSDNGRDLTLEFLELMASGNDDEQHIAFLYLKCNAAKNVSNIETILTATERLYDRNGEFFECVVISLSEFHKDLFSSIAFGRLAEKAEGIVQWHRDHWGFERPDISECLEENGVEKLLEKSIDGSWNKNYIKCYLRNASFCFRFDNIVTNYPLRNRYNRYALVIISPHLDNEDEKVIPFLINSLGDVCSEIRYSAYWSLYSCNRRAIPALVETIRQGGGALVEVAMDVLKTIDEYTYNLIVVERPQLLRAKAENERFTASLAIMGERAFKCMESLKQFRKVGEFCRHRGVDNFTNTEISKELLVSANTVTNWFNSVSNLFKLYHKLQGRLVPDDKDEQIEQPEKFKLFERGQGKWGTTIYPLGWEAWEMTCQFLDDEEQRSARK